MISAVSGLPAIIIDRFAELDNQIDLSAKENLNRLNNEEKMKNSYSIKYEESNSLAAKESQQIDYNKLADKLKSVLGENDLAIEFYMDKDLNRMVMKLINSDTNEVVQQFPPDVTLKIARIVASTMGNGNVTNATV